MSRFIFAVYIKRFWHMWILPNAEHSNSNFFQLMFGVRTSYYLITWNFSDTLISRFWGSHISRHLNFAILRKFYILIHFNLAFLSETHFISLSMLFNMSLNLIVEAIERFRQLVEQHHKELVNGRCYLEWRRKAVVMKSTRTLPHNGSKWLL